MLANLATALFEHGKITTTEARARRLRPVAERLITFAKRGDLHARRQVLTMVTDRNGVPQTLFAGTGAEPRQPARAVTPGSPGRTHGAGQGAPGTRQAVCGALLRRTLTTETASCYPTGVSDPGYSMLLT